jgi:hypothetical protein
MANQRTTFMKRQREQNKKDKHRAKEQRLAARRAEARSLRESPPATDHAAAPIEPTAPAPPTDGETAS